MTEEHHAVVSDPLNEAIALIENGCPRTHAEIGSCEFCAAAGLIIAALRQSEEQRDFNADSCRKNASGWESEEKAHAKTRADLASVKEAWEESRLEFDGSIYCLGVCLDEIKKIGGPDWDAVIRGFEIVRANMDEAFTTLELDKR